MIDVMIINNASECMTTSMIEYIVFLSSVELQYYGAESWKEVVSLAFGHVVLTATGETTKPERGFAHASLKRKKTLSPALVYGLGTSRILALCTVTLALANMWAYTGSKSHTAALADAKGLA